MKNILLAALLLVPSAAFAATEAPATINGYLPTDTFVKGANVKVDFGENFQNAAKPVQEAVSKASKELIAEIQKNAKPDEPLPFDERLGISKEAYDNYIKAWESRTLKPVEEVAARLEPIGDNKWKMLAISVSNQAPLPLHNLVYDAAKDIWTTPNGDLVRKEDVKFGKNNLFGEWSGPQWVYEDKSSLGTVIENFALGKSPQGKDIFLVYRLVELASNNQPVFQNMYVIRIDGKDMKADPLKAAARAKAEAKKNK